MIFSSSKSCLGYILDFLPVACRKSILDLKSRCSFPESSINEIRLRYMRNVSLTVANKNYLLDYIMTDDDIKSTIRYLCKGSVYAYQKTIKQGYIPIDYGARVGVVGDITNDDFDLAIESIRSINIRIPAHMRGICAKVYELFIKHAKSIIIYASPGVGKTTLLRDLSIELSRGEGALRVALIDSRHELDNGYIPSDCLIDTYGGYPKSVGIEIATRTMSSEVIICDEIGADDVSGIRKSIYCGVPVIAAVHASSVSDLYSRDGINMLIKEGAFEFAVGLKRNGLKKNFDYETTNLGELR